MSSDNLLRGQKRSLVKDESIENATVLDDQEEFSSKKSRLQGDPDTTDISDRISFMSLLDDHDRNLESDENIAGSLNSLKGRGFINYFYLAHFGTPPVSYYEIGKALLLGNWKDAIELITTPQDKDNSLSAKIRFFWSLANSKTRKGPQQPVDERLLMGITRCLANDHIVALKCIPFQRKLKYVQSYQGYLWNLIVSRRIKIFGLAVLDGDLFNDDKSKVKRFGFSREAFHATAKIFHKSDAMLATGLSIEDVVMPLPGCDVIYPDNEISALYRDTLASEGFDIDNFRRDIKMLKFDGVYRKIIVKPKNLSWKVGTHNEANDKDVTIDTDVPLWARTPERALTMEFSLPSASTTP